MPPAVTDRVQTTAKLHCDLFGGDADVEFTPAESTCPRPDVAIEPVVQITHEVVGQQIVEHDITAQHGDQQRRCGVLVDGLFEVVYLCFGDRVVQQRPNGREQCIQLVGGDGRFAVTRPEGQSVPPTQVLEELLDALRTHESGRNGPEFELSRRLGRANSSASHSCDIDDTPRHPTPPDQSPGTTWSG
ncbi:MAG TPA: hypothetical protein VIW24_25730 [Aldersonia sp.]